MMFSPMMGAVADTILDDDKVEDEGEGKDYEDGKVVGPGEGA